jgi:hypothetical protein
MLKSVLPAGCKIISVPGERSLEQTRQSCSRENAQKAQKPNHFASFVPFGGYMIFGKALARFSVA